MTRSTTVRSPLITSLEDQISEFYSQPLLVKSCILHDAKKQRELDAQTAIIMTAITPNPEHYILVGSIGDVAVVFNKLKSDSNNGYGYSSLLRNESGWEYNSFMFKTADEAYLHALGIKYDGLNTQFGEFAARMLGIHNG